MTFAAAPFSADSPDARRYNRLSRRLSLAESGLGLLVMALLLATGWTRLLRDLAFRAIGENYLLALFMYVLFLALLSKLLALGLDLYGFRLEHRYHLSNQRLRAWLWDQLKEFVIGLVISTILAELLYLLIRKFPQAWWIVAWGAFMALSALFVQIAPVVLFPLFYKFRPLENQELRNRLTRLSERAGTKIRGVYEWSLSEKSKKANAALAGWGATRRIILSDTLLAGYTDDEIEAVLAHELGHHVHRHILKAMLLQAVISFAGFWLLKWVLRWAVLRREWFISQYDFASLPLIVLVTTVLSLVLMPMLKGYSRHNERQADRYAWKSIAAVEPFITAMNKLAEQNLAERQPSRLVELLFHSHPPIAKRIAAAQAWAKARS
jgi:STE24 endopeptidase